MTEMADIDPNGMVVLSEKPGFGVELDEARLKSTRIG
jgi:L-alanine-DL-glutamate epimerase-like enolase superfamily enzyme